MTARTLFAAGAAALALLAAAAPTAAETRRVTVPADRADPAAGSIRLHVERDRAARRARGTVLYLAGGPGSAATAEVGLVTRALGSRLLARRDVVAFDARGTGRSDLVVCPELQSDRSLRSTDAAAACARRLGARRARYSVADQVADVEAVRRALRIRRMDLIGISYGTEVAQRYAQAHPSRVGRIVLDSVLPPEGPSALGEEVFAGLRRVLGLLCTRNRCKGAVRSPQSELPALVERLRAAPLEATVFGPRGRAARATLDRVRLLDLLLAGDFSPGIRAALPGAVMAARRGDAAQLLRLLALDRLAFPTPPAREFSVGLYATTSCETLAFPWDPAADPATRRAQAAQRLRQMGDAPFAPFDAETILDADFLPLCLGWPAPVRPAAAVAREVPPIPTLLIAGEEDLRTPVEAARNVAVRNPGARLLVVPGAGHSVVSSDDTGCAARAMRAYVARVRGPRSCRGPRSPLPPLPIPPQSLAELGPVDTPARLVARTIRALDQTIDDATLALVVGATRGGGLRGGSYALGPRGLTLRGFAYVPGVPVDARPRRGGGLVVRIGGTIAARGELTVTRAGSVRGRLGGRRVRARLRAPLPSF